jgi:hypothetical protein
MVLANPSTAMIVPMAISLGFGVLFATAITLILVPCLYLIAEDFFPWPELQRAREIEAQESSSAASDSQPA